MSKPTPPRRTLLGTLRTYFLTGIVITAPFSITVYLVILVVEVLDGWFTPLLPANYNPNLWLPFDLPGLGVLIALVLLTVIGGLAANFLGRALVNIGESLIARMPFVGAIYIGLKQIFQAAIQERNDMFQQVGMIEYPRRGLFAIVFVTNEVRTGPLADALPAGRLRRRDWLTVFLPTTPNPTSGFFLLVPREDVTLLPFSVEEGAKLVISAGLVHAPQQTSVRRLL